MYARTWCSMHYNRWRTKGDPEGQVRTRRPGRGCEVEGCDRPHFGRGYCRLHHHRLWKYGDPGELAMRRNPNGEGNVTVNGYRTIYATNHPNANSRGRILEHILVVSQALGRPLTKGENVHHKNGDRLDNSLDNLELWYVGQPAGQRVADLLTWAVENYRPQVEQLLKGEQVSLPA